MYLAIIQANNARRFYFRFIPQRMGAWLLTTWLGIGSLVCMAVNVGSLGRHKNISRSALSTVLDELKDNEFPSSTSRQTIKKKRDEAVDVETRYGRLLQNWEVTLVPVGKKKKKVLGQSPNPNRQRRLRFHLCSQCLCSPICACDVLNFQT